MKRLVAALGITLVILGVVSSFLFHQNCNLVRITGFEITGAMMSPDGRGYYSSAEVTLQNFGINDVEGLVLWVNYTAPIEIGPDNVDYYMKRVQLGFVHAGETRNVTVGVVWWASYGKQFVASLMLDDIVLDEFVYSTSG